MTIGLFRCVYENQYLFCTTTIEIAGIVQGMCIAQMAVLLTLQNQKSFIRKYDLIRYQQCRNRTFCLFQMGFNALSEQPELFYKQTGCDSLSTMKKQSTSIKLQIQKIAKQRTHSTQVKIDFAWTNGHSLLSFFHLINIILIIRDIVILYTTETLRICILKFRINRKSCYILFHMQNSMLVNCRNQTARQKAHGQETTELLQRP